MIPKFIWSYWDSEDMPDIVKLCIESWKKHNPDWAVLVLHKHTWRRYVTQADLASLKFNDSHERFSDFLRIYLLREYGGVWMDASMICFAPLDTWITPIMSESRPEFIGFTINHVTSDWTYPLFESWFMACEKNSVFMAEIYQEAIVNFNTFDNIDTYFEHLKEQGVNLHTLGENHYLAVYFCIQKVMQKSPNKSTFRIKTLEAEDPRLGPMYYMVAPQSDQSEGASNLMKLCTDTSTRTALVKLRKDERKEIEERPELACVLKLKV